MFTTLMIPVVTILLSATDEAALKQRVLDEYPKAVIRLEEVFSSVRGTMCYYHEKAVGTAEESIQSWHIEFACDGNNRKYSRRRLETMPIYERVLARNRLYQFRLVRTTADAPLLVEDYTSQVGNTEDFDQSWETFVAPGINAAFLTDVAAELRTGEFKVDRVSEVDRDGVVMLKIEYHVEKKEKSTVENDELRKFYQELWLLVSPSEAWVMVEWFQRAGKTVPGRPFSGRVEYQGKNGDIPIPRTVVSLEAPPYRDITPFKRSFDISELQFKKTPEREFTLTFFGLPEMGRPTKQGLNLFGYGFVAVGCVLIALAAAIKYRAARR